MPITDILDILGITSTNTRYILVDSLQTSLDQIDTVDEYQTFLYTLYSNNMFDTIKSCGKLTTSSEEMINNIIETMNNVNTKLYTILKENDFDLDHVNIYTYYQSSTAMLTALSNLEVVEASKNSFYEIIYANYLRSSKLAEYCNIYINMINENTTLDEEYFVMVILMNTICLLMFLELIKSLDGIIQVNSSILDFADQLYTNSIISVSTLNKIKEVVELTYNTDLEYCNSLNDILYSNLNSINGVL